MSEEDRATIIRNGRKPGWFWCENRIFDDCGHIIGPYGLSVYLCLCRHCDNDGKTWPSHAFIARETGMNARTVIRTLYRLVKLGMVQAEHRTSPDGDPATNLYTVGDLPSREVLLQRLKELAEEEGVVTVSQGGSDSESPGVVTVSHLKETQLEGNPEKETHSFSPAGESNKEQTDAGAIPAPDPIRDGAQPGRPPIGGQDERDHPVPGDGGARAGTGARPATDAAGDHRAGPGTGAQPRPGLQDHPEVAAFEARQRVIARALHYDHDEDGDPDDDDPRRFPKWSQPDSDEQVAFLTTCHAKRFQQKQKARVKALHKALLAADLLRPEDCYAQAQRQGPLAILPRTYYEERLKQADQYRWSVWNLINYLEDADALSRHCQRRLKELSDAKSGRTRAARDRPPEPGCNAALPEGWL